jgi:hypothetical protein
VVSGGISRTGNRYSKLTGYAGRRLTTNFSTAYGKHSTLAYTTIPYCYGRALPNSKKNAFTRESLSTTTEPLAGGRGVDNNYILRTGSSCLSSDIVLCEFGSHGFRRLRRATVVLPSSVLFITRFSLPRILLGRNHMSGLPWVKVPGGLSYDRMAMVMVSVVVSA